MNSGAQIETILTVVTYIGWIALGVLLLRRGPSPIGWKQQPVPSLARRALIASPLLLLMMATSCVLALKEGVRPERLGDYLLLRDFGTGFFYYPRWSLPIFYAFYLFVIIAPSFLSPEPDKANRFNEGFFSRGEADLPPGKPVNVSAEWKQRCDKFRTQNRRWLIAAFALLAAAGILAVSGLTGILNDDAYLYAGLLLVVGFAVLLIAAVTLPRMLVCPNCDCTPLRRSFALHRWLDEIEKCERCQAKLG